MHTVCVSVQSENRSRSLGPKNKIEDEESERERERGESENERKRERERGNFATRGEPNVSLKFVETPWLSYILWNNGLGRENNRFTNEQRLLR